MTCESTTELLPFLLNGSLTDAERTETLQHLRACDDCRQVLREVAFVWIASDAHPPAEWLVDYAQGYNLEALPRELLEQHLASCDVCTQAVVVAGPPSMDPLSFPTPETLPELDPPPRLDETKGWHSLAIAASLLAATLIGVFFGAEFKPEAPIANVAIAELFPIDERVRGTDDPTVTISRTSTTALVLVPSSPASGRDVRVIVVEETGQLVIALHDLERSERSDFTLLLPSASLPPGALTLRLEAQREDGWGPIGEYRGEVEN